MSYDEALAGRLREAFAGTRGAREKRMFGGLAFMLGDHMACGVIGRDLVVRVGPDRHAEALREPHARPMDFTGKPLRGYVYVSPAGCRTAAALRAWVARAVRHVATLPAKRPGKKARRAQGRRGAAPAGPGRDRSRRGR